MHSLRLCVSLSLSSLSVSRSLTHTLTQTSHPLSAHSLVACCYLGDVMCHFSFESAATEKLISPAALQTPGSLSARVFPSETKSRAARAARAALPASLRAAQQRRDVVYSPVERVSRAAPGCSAVSFKNRCRCFFHAVHMAEAAASHPDPLLTYSHIPVTVNKLQHHAPAYVPVGATW